MGRHFWKSKPLGSFVFCHLKYECFFLAAGPLLRMHVSAHQNVHSFHVSFLLHKSSIHKLFGVHFKPKHSGNAEELPLALTWIEITQQDHITWHVLSKPLCFFVTSSTRNSNSRGQNHCALQTQNSKWTCDLQHHDRANNIILHLQIKHAQKKMSLRWWLRAIAHESNESLKALFHNEPKGTCGGTTQGSFSAPKTLPGKGSRPAQQLTCPACNLKARGTLGKDQCRPAGSTLIAIAKHSSRMAVTRRLLGNWNLDALAHDCQLSQLIAPTISTKSKQWKQHS